VVLVLKLNFILGFVLLVCFIMFIFAGSAGPDSEIPVGTMGFFGMIALLPLFLYLVNANAKMKREAIEVQIKTSEKGEQPKDDAADYEGEPGELPKEPTPTYANGIDRNFIEGLRTEKKDPSDLGETPPPTKETHDSFQERLGVAQIDIPNKVENESKEMERKEEKEIDSEREDKPKKGENQKDEEDVDSSKPDN
jgi:hypothetical protein